jgi:hypothetical protein
LFKLIKSSRLTFWNHPHAFKTHMKKKKIPCIPKIKYHDYRFNTIRMLFHLIFSCFCYCISYLWIHQKNKLHWKVGEELLLSTSAKSKKRLITRGFVLHAYCFISLMEWFEYHECVAKIKIMSHFHPCFEIFWLKIKNEHQKCFLIYKLMIKGYHSFDKWKQKKLVLKKKLLAHLKN